MVETTAQFRTSRDVVARDVPDGMMLVNVQTGAAFKLNAVGAAVWRQLDGARDVTAIVADLQRRYGVEADRLRADLDSLFEDLQKQNLVERLPSPPP